MDITIKSLKFDADKKLLAFTEKKIERLAKFFAGAQPAAEVTLSLEKDGKAAKLQIHIPGESVIISRCSDTFENSITACVDAAKEKLTREKEKKYEK